MQYNRPVATNIVLMSSYRQGKTAMMVVMVMFSTRVLCYYPSVCLCVSVCMFVFFEIGLLCRVFFFFFKDKTWKTLVFLVSSFLALRGNRAVGFSRAVLCLGLHAGFGIECRNTL